MQSPWLGGTRSSRLASRVSLASAARTSLQDHLVDWPNSSSCSCLTPLLVRPRRHSGWGDKAAHHSIGVILVAAPAAIGRADPALPMAAPPGRRATGGADNHSLHLHDDLPGPPARATDRPATPRRATTRWALTYRGTILNGPLVEPQNEQRAVITNFAEHLFPVSEGPGRDRCCPLATICEPLLGSPRHRR